MATTPREPTLSWIDTAYQLQCSAIALMVLSIYFLHIVPTMKKVDAAVDRIETIEERIGKLIEPHLKDQESWQKSLDVLHSPQKD